MLPLPYVILQHIPKSASSSLSKVFTNSVRYGFQLKQCKLNQDIPHNSEHISFTVLRNPYYRLLSCIHMFLSRSKYDVNKIIEIILENNFTDTELQEGINWKNTDFSIGLHSASIFHPFLNVFDKNDILLAKYLVDFDNMIPDLKQIVPGFDMSAIPHLNSSQTKDEIFLTYSQIEKFKEKYRKDISFYENFKKSRYYENTPTITSVRI